MDALVRPFFVENRSDEGVQATVCSSAVRRSPLTLTFSPQGRGEGTREGSPNDVRVVSRVDARRLASAQDAVALEERSLIDGLRVEPV